MPNKRKPRAGSLQFWPRKRCKRAYARTRTFPESKETGVTGFAGYKVGMTHILAIETDKHSPRKGQEIAIPATIVECPPLKMLSLRLYKKQGAVLTLAKEILLENKDKTLAKKVQLPKKKLEETNNVNPEEYDDARVIVYTQPKLAGIGKKKPEVFELGLGGSIEEKIKFVDENKDKEISLDAVFKEGDYLDLKAITRGKGFQGPVKRFGIHIRESKAEKSIRNPGSLGPWCGQGKIMWRVAHAGKMGYHQRTEYNKQIIKIVNNAEETTPKGGFLNYGNIKTTVMLIKGSVAGSKKRLIVMQKASRLKKPKMLPTVEKISTHEVQGN